MKAKLSKVEGMNMLYAAFLIAKVQLRALMVDRFFLISLVVTPLGLATLFYFIHSHLRAEVSVADLILGSGLLGIWGASMWGAGFSIERERRDGTLEYLVATPTPVFFVVAAKCFVTAVLANCSLALSVFWLYFVFHLPLSIAHPLYFTIALLTSTLSFSMLGLVIGHLFILSRNVERLGDFFTFPIYLLSGVIFPASWLPTPLNAFSYLLPLAWAKSLLQMALINKEIDFLFHSYLFILLTISFVYFILAIHLTHRVERRARLDGTLGG